MPGLTQDQAPRDVKKQGGGSELLLILLFGGFAMLWLANDAFVTAAKLFIPGGIAMPLSVESFDTTAAVMDYRDPDLPITELTGTVTQVVVSAEGLPLWQLVGMITLFTAGYLALIGAIIALLFFARRLLRGSFFTLANECALLWMAWLLFAWVVTSNAFFIIAQRFISAQHPGTASWQFEDSLPSANVTVLGPLIVLAVLLAFRRARRLQEDTEGLI